MSRIVLYSAQRVGKSIGRQLALSKQIKRIHCVGISVGSFAADSCISEFCRARRYSNETLSTHLTLLCPFQQRGIIGFNYGAKHFGTSAEFCEQFYSSDDPVPSCKSRIHAAHSIDVATSKLRNSFTSSFGDGSIHSFPVYYYGSIVVQKKNFNIWPSKKLIHTFGNLRGTEGHPS